MGGERGEIPETSVCIDRGVGIHLVTSIHGDKHGDIYLVTPICPVTMKVHPSLHLLSGHDHPASPRRGPP